MFVAGMSFRIPPTSKYVQMATAGRATGVWDKRENTFYFQMPSGITKGYMEFSGIPGYYQFDFDMAQCSGSYVNWGDYDYDYERVTGFNLKESSQGGVDHDQLLQIIHFRDYTPDLKTTIPPGLGQYQNQGIIALPLAGHTVQITMLLDRHHIIPDLYPLLEIPQTTM